MENGRGPFESDSSFSCLQERSQDPVTGSIVETDLCDGDILTMEGRMQRHCLHFVPKCNPREPIRHERINITFRWVCTLRLLKRGLVTTEGVKPYLDSTPTP
ncbi:Eif4e1b [Symbiodinium sp. CCMP2592]|nr:Eif4e1b [Symbiodinium sp. CCMP2592]